MTVSVYVAAARSDRGTFAFAAGRTANELSRWTSVRRKLIHLRAGARAIETVTLTVPTHAAPGARYAVVWAQVSGAGNEAGVRLVNRVGVRMYISVGPGGAPAAASAASFTLARPVATRSASGAPRISARVTNTGSPVTLHGTLLLSGGPGGLTAGPYPLRVDALAQGGRGSASVVLDRRLPRGPWHAAIVLQGGAVERRTAGLVTFPLAVAAASEGRRSWSRSAVLLAGAVLLAAAAAGAILRMSGRPASRAQAPGRSHPQG